MQYKFTRFFASRGFWIFLLAFFIVEALWIALSAVYPMAFDEDFHLGVIRLYAGQHSPFLNQLPNGAQVYGAIHRDPSYLYHYLMSFPYMFFHLITGNTNIQIILLRLINILLFLGALIVWRKVLLRGGLSRATAHVLLFFFILIPITPLLAGQINYDNLLILLIAWVCYLTQGIIQAYRRNQLPLELLFGLISLCLVTNIVKYAFLPIALATVVFVIAYTIKQFRSQIFHEFLVSWRGLTLLRRLILCGVLLLSFGLFFERYGMNMILYHTPIPDCAKVLDNEACLQYGPWNRDYYLAQSKPSRVSSNPITYTRLWSYGMWFRLFFTINGEVGGSESYQNYSPLPVIGFGAAILFLGGALALCKKGYKLLRQNITMLYFALITALYCLILWYQNYQMFLQTGQAVAVNGRYLLMIMIPFGALCMQSIRLILQRRFSILKPFITVIALIIFLQGGGISSFIVRSNDSWYWPNPIVRGVNKAAQSVLQPIIIGSRENLKILSP